MMKRWIAILVGALVLIFSACMPPETAVPNLQSLLEDAGRLIGEGKYEEAILAYEAIIVLEPKNADAYAGLAEVYGRLNDQEKAAAVLQRGITATGGDEVLSGLLKAYGSSGVDDSQDTEYQLDAISSLPTPKTTPTAEPLASCQTEGVYTFFSAGSDMVINLSGKTDQTTDKNGTKIILWSSTDSNMQRFRIEPKSGDACRLYALSSSDGYGRVLEVDTGGDTPQVGDPINLWEVTEDDDTQLWLIERQVDGYYVLRLESRPELVMDCGDVGDEGSMLTLQKYTAALTQRWQLKKIDVITPEDVLTAIMQSPGAWLPGKTYAELRKQFGEPLWADFSPDEGDLLCFDGMTSVSANFGSNILPWDDLLTDEQYSSGELNVKGDIVDQYIDPTRQCEIAIFFLNRVCAIPAEGIDLSGYSGNFDEWYLGFYGYEIHFAGYRLLFESQCIPNNSLVAILLELDE